MTQKELENKDRLTLILKQLIRSYVGDMDRDDFDVYISQAHSQIQALQLSEEDMIPIIHNWITENHDKANKGKNKRVMDLASALHKSAQQKFCKCNGKEEVGSVCWGCGKSVEVMPNQPKKDKSAKEKMNG